MRNILEYYMVLKTIKANDNKHRYHILMRIMNAGYSISNTHYYDLIKYMENEELVILVPLETEHYCNVHITKKGLAYLHRLEFELRSLLVMYK